MEKNIKTGICANCGADNGLHHFETMQCPKNGFEEYRDDRKQEYQNTFFEDKGIKDYEQKAIAEYDKLKSDNALLTRKLESLIYVLEMERKQNGISLSDDYRNLYKESKELLNQIK